MNLKNFIIGWNNEHPYDYWWRKSHGILFGSKEHFESNFIDQKIEYIQQRLEEDEYGGKYRDFEDYKETGVWLKSKVLTKEEEDKIFNSIDLSVFK